MNTLRVDKDHPWYTILVNHFKENGKPGQFNCLGHRWQHITDNNNVFFVAIGGTNLDSRYGEGTVRL